jgi:hypothetical protein
MLYGMMHLIVEFVEVEKCFEVIDFEASTQWKQAGDTIREIYDWWKDHPNRLKEIEVSLDNWYSVKFEGLDPNIDDPFIKLNGHKDTPESKRHSKLMDSLEAKLLAEEEEMLIKIIKIRKFLWT